MTVNFDLVTSEMAKVPQKNYKQIFYEKYEILRAYLKQEQLFGTIINITSMEKDNEHRLNDFIVSSFWSAL